MSERLNPMVFAGLHHDEYFTPILHPLSLKQFNVLSELRQDAYLKHPEWFTALNIDDIVFAVCSHFKLPVNEVLGMCRKRELTIPRQIAIYFCKKKTKASLKYIGAHFNRDHSTIIYSVSVVEDLMDSDKAYKKMVKEISDAL